MRSYAEQPDQTLKQNKVRPRIRELPSFTTHKVRFWAERHFRILLRLSLGLIYLWFGALKFIPDLSPAENLVGATIDEISHIIPVVSLPTKLMIWLLAVWETAIGLGLISGQKQRLFLTLLAFQLMGAALPIVLLPEMVWSSFPLALTLEGQYIIKNLMIITGAIAYASTMPEHNKGSAGKTMVLSDLT